MVCSKCTCRYDLARCLSILSAASIWVLLGGCHSILNGWLDPSVVGSFTGNRTNEIRASLTLEDTPPGIPGAEWPAPIDHVLIIEEYPISAGDSLLIEINELRQRDLPYQTQVQITGTGYANIPIVGRVSAAGLTVPQFEKAIADALISRGQILEPQVTVNAVFLHRATFSIFGRGAGAGNNSPIRPGTFPIRRPDTRLLEAINQVGGLNELVTEVYIFRNYQPPTDQDLWGTRNEPIPSSGMTSPSHATPDTPTEIPPPEPDDRTSRTEEQAILDVVLEGDSPVGETNAETVDDEREALMKELEPDPSDPLIWVDGEFVANPSYRPPSPELSPQIAEPPPNLDTAAPAARWARIAGDSWFRILRVSGDTLRTGDLEANIYVRPGDLIRLVQGEVGTFYVMGQVNRVGAFGFNSETITLKSAIAAAGGLSALAWPDRCTIYRRVGRREQMIQVNLDRIFAGQDQDFLIRRSDIINVGTHPFAPFLQRIRQLTLPNIVNNVGYGFTYARNFADIDSFAVKRNPSNQPDQFPSLFP